MKRLSKILSIHLSIYPSIYLYGRLQCITICPLPLPAKAGIDRQTEFCSIFSRNLQKFKTVFLDLYHSSGKCYDLSFISFVEIYNKNNMLKIGEKVYFLNHQATDSGIPHDL